MSKFEDAPLTTREQQVLDLIAQGKTNRAIAEELNLAVRTVDTHRTRLMKKLNIHTQTLLVKHPRTRSDKSPGDETGSLSAADKDRPHGGKLGALADSQDTLPQASGDYPRKAENPPQLSDEPADSTDRQDPKDPPPRHNSTQGEISELAVMRRLRAWIAEAMNQRDDLDPATLHAILEQMDRIRREEIR
jgi:DNA-binding CsgD family transcriptional regulator